MIGKESQVRNKENNITITAHVNDCIGGGYEEIPLLQGIHREECIPITPGADQT
jgi:hypothetical protein